MYGLLFYNIKTKINKVGPVIARKDNSADEFGGIYIGQPSKNDQDRTSR